MNQFTKLNLLSFTWAFLVIQAIIFPLFLDSGLSKSEAFSVMGIFSIAMAILDVPGGILSDRIGRKATLILAGLFKGMGGMVLIFAQQFWGFAFAYVLIGIANSLISGTDLALLYETHADVENEKRPPIFDLLAQRNLWSKYGTALSSLLGGALGSFGYTLPLVMNAVFAWLALGIAFRLKDPTKREKDLTIEPQAKFKWREILEETHRQKVFIFALVTLSLILVSAQWSFQMFWKSKMLSPLWLGVLWAIYSLMGGHAVKFSLKIFGEHPIRLIFSSLFVVAIGLAGAGLMPGVWGLVFCFFVPAGLSPALVQLRHLLNSDLQPAWRATLNSVDSFLSRGIFFLLSPFLGVALGHYTYKEAFVFVSLLIAFSLLLVASGLAFRFSLTGRGQR